MFGLSGNLASCKVCGDVMDLRGDALLGPAGGDAGTPEARRDHSDQEQPERAEQSVADAQAQTQFTTKDRRTQRGRDNRKSPL